MSTFISEPGTRLGGRYRLEDRVSDTGGWSAWKAIDETLARPVGVLTFAPGFPRLRETCTAARAASRLSDARIAQVFDVEDDWENAYVVMEWVAGDSLGDLLADGPMDPARAAEIIAEGAEALAVAHAAGLAHLCLTTETLRWTPGGGVKVLGVGINAALTDAFAEDPALADTRGLATLLYAALTCCWPGPGESTMPPAPLADGQPCSPRQVCAGVPASIDEVTCQALFQRERRHGPPLTTPALLADALAEVIPAPLAPPPAIPGPPVPPRQPDFGEATMASREAGLTGRLDYDYPGGRSRPAGMAPPGWRRERPVAARALIAVIVVLVLAAVAAGVWSIVRHGGSSSPTAGSSHSARPPSATSAVLTPVSAGGYDALGLSQDPSNENNSQAKFAIDSSPTSAWHTQFYDGSPSFGNLKAGTGLILDMGKPVKLSSVQVTFGPSAGANVSIEVGNNNSISPAGLHSFATVATQSDVGGGAQTFQTSSTATGRYVLIWFTKLPPLPGSSNRFEALVYDVVVHGSS